MKENDVKVYRPEHRTAGNAQKKSSRPTQPGNRSATFRKKQTSIFSRFVSICKRVYWGRVAMLVLAIIGAVYLASSLIGAIVGAIWPTEEEEQNPHVEFVFTDGNGSPVDVQGLTNAWAEQADLKKRYELTDAERREVASVVTAEAAGEPFAGKVAVAQCILQACEDDGIRPAEALVKYSYAKSRPEPTEEALEAVQAVFDFGQVAANEPIKYFYAPARCQSEWHESQVYVVTINGHKFFKEAN